MSSKIYRNVGNRAVLAEVNGTKLEILDVGCGAGDNARILSDLGHLVDGITYSEEEIKICKVFMRAVYNFDLNLGLPDHFNKSYDVVICSHVIEHLAQPDQLLQDFKRVMTSESVIIIALPNVMHYKSRLKLLAGKFDYEESGIWDNTHLKWYTFKTGRELLERNGFTITKSWVEGEMPALRTFRWLPAKVKNGIFRLLSGISKGLFGGQLLYKARISV